MQSQNKCELIEVTLSLVSLRKLLEQKRKYLDIKRSLTRIHNLIYFNGMITTFDCCANVVFVYIVVHIMKEL